MTFAKMPRHRGPIITADDQMNMQGRRAGRTLGDVADE